jgi:hypothetical protein
MVDGSVRTAFGFVLGVPVHEALARSNSLMVALATSVVTVILRSVPAVAFTAVVAAEMITDDCEGTKLAADGCRSARVDIARIKIASKAHRDSLIGRPPRTRLLQSPMRSI